MSASSAPEHVKTKLADKPHQQRRILAFDFGTHRIGVAIGQELTGTATPLDPLPAKDGIPNWSNLGKLINDWQPDAFVVGIPLNMDGTASEMSVRARKFGRRLHGRYHKPSYGMDERLSTRAAKALLHEHSTTQKKGVSVDSVAAKLILESWLREQQLKSPTAMTEEKTGDSSGS